jgi:hypothetical protein
MSFITAFKDFKEGLRDSKSPLPITILLGLLALCVLLQFIIPILLLVRGPK